MAKPMGDKHQYPIPAILSRGDTCSHNVDEGDETTMGSKVPRSRCNKLVNPSKEEEWNANFDKAKRFHKANGHLSTQNKTLNQWITYQRLHAKKLSDKQLNLLDSIGYKDAGGFRKCDEETWADKLSLLKRIRNTQGDLKRLPGHLTAWISKQRLKARNGTFEPKKRVQLEDLGISLSSNNRKKDGTHMIRDMPRWNSQYENLKRFRDIHGHCNVPKRYSEDKSLAAWVSAQRRKYKQLKELDASLNPEWVKCLESIDFEWTCKQERSQIR